MPTDSRRNEAEADEEAVEPKDAVGSRLSIFGEAVFGMRICSGGLDVSAGKLCEKGSGLAWRSAFSSPRSRISMMLQLGRGFPVFGSSWSGEVERRANLEIGRDMGRDYGVSAIESVSIR